MRGAVAVLTLTALAVLLSWLWPRIDRPPSTQAIAHELLAQGRPREALLLLEDRVWRGIAEYRAGRYDRALGEFFPSDGVLQNYNLGTTFARLEDWNGAIAAYQKVLRLDPDHADARHNLEIVLKISKLEADKAAPAQQNRELPMTEESRAEPPDPGAETPRDEGSGGSGEEATASDTSAPDRSATTDSPGKLGRSPRSDEAGTADTVGTPEDETEAGQGAPGAAALRARESAQKAEIMLRQIVDDPEHVLRRRLHAAQQLRQPEGRE